MKKVRLKNYLLYDSIYMMFWKGKTATAEKRSEVFQDLEVRGRTDYKGTTQGNFEGVTVLYLEFCICQN